MVAPVIVRALRVHHTPVAVVAGGAWAKARTASNSTWRLHPEVRHYFPQISLVKASHMAMPDSEGPGNESLQLA